MRKRLSFIFINLLALVMILTSPVDGQSIQRPTREERIGQRINRPKPPRGAANTILPSEVTALSRLSIILGRPTNQSVTISILSADLLEGYIEYGSILGNYPQKTGILNLPAGKPMEVIIDQLPMDKPCYYRFNYRNPGDPAYTKTTEYSFHTQRSPGSAFTFEIQGDSHPERPQQFDPALYAQTITHAAADHPDFYMTIGDDFSVDALREVTAYTVAQRYQLQRSYLGLVAHSAPLFLVNGNHEQAALCNLDGTPNNVAVWAQTSRNKYFPQPAPDNFYTGDTQSINYIGLLRDYYAWSWGDALFVVIDPYWHSSQPVDNSYSGGKKNGRDLWDITLGDAQYRWLKQTLEQSNAKYKFVFTHHVHGTTRGGIETADLYEWGGRDRNGYYVFEQKRPGWQLPIHPLMVKNGVTIFFQGHDHIFAKQVKDDVIYQTLPEPADPNYTTSEWGSAYRIGDIYPNSGRLRVNVGPEKVHVEYVHSYLPKDATIAHPDGEIAFSYDVPNPINHFRRNQ